jgi:hypothetical protein
MSIRHAEHCDAEDRTVLVRQSQDSDTWHWAHPSDGAVHGSTTSDYVTFNSATSAVMAARRYGYTVTFDYTDNELLALLSE